MILIRTSLPLMSGTSSAKCSNLSITLRSFSRWPAPTIHTPLGINLKNAP
jgi:hypothetical protein